MANIDLSLKEIKTVALTIFNKPFYVPVFVVNQASTAVGNNDNARLLNVYLPIGVKKSYFAACYLSNEVISNINIGETLSQTADNKTQTINRVNQQRFSFTTYAGSSDTYTIDYNTTGCITIGNIIEFSDGVWICNGSINSGNIIRGNSVSQDFSGYFPYSETIQSYFLGTVSCYKNSYSIADGATLLQNITPTDPYSGAGDSTSGGGGGSFDGSSDPVAVPSLPSVGATNTGFISLFVPSQAQLKQVADYLWSGLFDLSTYLKIFENPMDCILGLSVVPITVPTSGSAQITVGNIELSGISLPLASQQYVEVDCGSIPFTDKFFGSYLDQDPYTKMALFVPYSGIHSVKADDIMGKTVNLKYHIDILTGSLVAFLTCGDSVLYEFNGACASNIPVNSINYASTIENAIRIAVNIGTTVATAGAAAPMTGATAAKGAADGARLFGTAVNMAGSTAEGILSLKPNIDRAGSLGGTTGLMGNQTPYFIITRPRLCKPANQNTFKGYPSFIQVTIGDLIGEGYTEFDTVILAGLYLTDSEKEELKQILESGVYL